jgi:hypothetical protein
MADSDKLRQAAEDYRDNGLTWGQIKAKYGVNHRDFYTTLGLLDIPTHLKRMHACPVCGELIPMRRKACCEEHREIAEANEQHGSIVRGELVPCRGGCGKFIKAFKSRDDTCSAACRKAAEAGRDAGWMRRFERAIDYGVELTDLCERFGLGEKTVRTMREEYRARKEMTRVAC